MKVRKENLLLIASTIWLVAGLNILHIGLDAFKNNRNFIYDFLALLVFILFWVFIFKNMVSKHTERILGYEDNYQHFLKFFDKKSFIIMFVMITVGIVVRSLPFIPIQFIAFFYTGLGSALSLAGLFFTIKFITNNEKSNRKTNSKLFVVSFIYLAITIIIGVIHQQLSNEIASIFTLVCLHLLILGTFIFMLIALLDSKLKLTKNKLFIPFVLLYNFSLPLLVFLIFSNKLEYFSNSIITYTTGLSHLLLVLSLSLLSIIFYSQSKKLKLNEQS